MGTSMPESRQFVAIRVGVPFRNAVIKMNSRQKAGPSSQSVKSRRTIIIVLAGLGKLEILDLIPCRLSRSAPLQKADIH